jgi:O-succinylbenzoate synthase
LAAVEPKLELGFRVFKWKVGVEPAADEWAILDDLLGRLPEGAKLRLDANGAWDRRTAEQWMERAAERPVEYVEQPCFAEASQGAALIRKTDDILRGLAEDYPTPIALDESLGGAGDVARWLAEDWRGVWILKPALFGEPGPVLAALSKAKADVVFGSALETRVGAQAALWGLCSLEVSSSLHADGFRHVLRAPLDYVLSTERGRCEPLMTPDYTI